MIVECSAGLSGAVAWFRIVSGLALVRMLLTGSGWRDVEAARRINVRVCRVVRF